MTDWEIEKLWAVEAEARVAAFERNEVEAIEANEVFAELNEASVGDRSNEIKTIH